MQGLKQWFQEVLARPRATLVLIACLAGLALVTSAWAYAVNSPPASTSPTGSQFGQTANTVMVTLYDSRITSSQATFKAEMQYRFTVANQGTVNHELMLMPQVIGPGMSMIGMDRLDQMALARTGDMAPGAIKSFDYTLPMSMAGHQGEFGCFYPGHYESGMHLPIAVTD